MLLQLGGLSLKKSQIFYESNASTRWAAATRRRGSATQRCVAATTKRVAASQMCKMFIDNKKPCPLPLKVLQCVAVCVAAGEMYYVSKKCGADVEGCNVCCSACCSVCCIGWNVLCVKKSVLQCVLQSIAIDM
mmetsp:Transcript_3299/g.5295  ORF Transcript_3299/g.5295 Transcript_3299/m.5295 type:complete len:133 (-) Transcript_3299:31-429(-)